MSDYKDKYLRAVKALDEVEREGVESIQGLYKILFSILGELKGQHKEIDKVIAVLPKSLSMNVEPPLDELDRIKDLIVSYFNKADEVGAAPSVLDALLSNLKVSDELHAGIEVLQNDLARASTSKDFVAVAKKIASLVLNSSSNCNAAASSESIEDIKQGLLYQLEKLKASDAELAEAIDIVSLIKSLSEVVNMRGLEFFYKQVFEGLGGRLSKKDEFIVELSGLIETVVHQLSELSMDIKKEVAKGVEAKKDRWRLTELMGGHINTLKDSVLEAGSLDVLKSMLAEQIDELNNTVIELTELESGRTKQAEAEAESITNKLAFVESEMSDLKKSLHKAHEQAFVDPLTGVANRRAYDERMTLEFMRWKRTKDTLLLAILDIDHFKNINDTFGHPVGDKVLRSISQLIDKQVRGSDFFGRIGGEEFAIIFTGSDLANAMKRLNEFRQSVEACKFGVKGKRLVITMSVGCAVFNSEDKPSDVYERADKALFKAKQTGRNKCLSEQDL